MIFFGFLIALAIFAETYFIAYKRHIENVSLASYMINILLLLIAVWLFVTTYDYEASANTSQWFFVAYGIILAVGITLSVIEWLYLKRNTFDINIIKNMVDDAGQGILVLRDKDKVMFQNSVMYWILDSLDIHTDYVNMIKKYSKKKIGRDYLLLIEGCAWLFGISDDGYEITAKDIDEEYRLQSRLEEQNDIINKNNEELEWVIDNIEELEREENSQRIRNRFHDVLGQNLSVLQAYLNQDIEDKDRFNEVKFMIKKMFTELSDTDDAVINLENLIRINHNIGIDIEVQGKLPEDKEKAKALFEVIREAVTNAVRHADSTKIFVNIADDAEGLYMTITNNGRKSNEIISENEGIRGMRRKIRTINGNLTVKTIPEFAINVSVPK